MQNVKESTGTFTFGRALYEASRRFDDLSQGKREDYRRSFGTNEQDAKADRYKVATPKAFVTD